MMCYFHYLGISDIAAEMQFIEALPLRLSIRSAALYRRQLYASHFGHRAVPFPAFPRRSLPLYERGFRLI